MTSRAQGEGGEFHCIAGRKCKVCKIAHSLSLTSEQSVIQKQWGDYNENTG